MTTVVVRSKACPVVTQGSWVGIPLGAYMYCICVVVIAADAVSRDLATAQSLLKTVFRNRKREAVHHVGRRRHLERKKGRKAIVTVGQ